MVRSREAEIGSRDQIARCFGPEKEPRKQETAAFSLEEGSRRHESGSCGPEGVPLCSENRRRLSGNEGKNYLKP